MSDLEIPERAYRAAECALAAWPVLSEEAVFAAVKAAAVVVVAVELRQMARAGRPPGPAAMMMRAAALDPEGVGK